MGQLEFHSVTKSFNTGKDIFSDLNLSFEESKFYFLSGPTGSGKSTILNLIHGAISPTTGKILIDGKEFNSRAQSSNRNSKHRAKIGYVYQDYRLLDHYSAKFNIELPLHIQGYSRKKLTSALEQTCERLKIKDLLNSKVANLSGGEKQLVSIARAIVSNPKILLVDEPSAHLDNALAQQILKTLIEINSTGITTLVTTHDLELIKAHRNAQIVLIENKQASIHNIK